MDFDKYQHEAHGFCLSSAWSLEYLIPGLAGEAGEVASLYAKYVRDETPREALRASMAKELGDVLWFVALLSEYFDLDLSVIAQQNINKLEDRQSRGALKGSGNDR